MTRIMLGYDITIKLYKNLTNFSYINIIQNNKQEEFILVEPVFIRPVVCGHGTICWKVFKKGNSKKFYIIKDS